MSKTKDQKYQEAIIRNVTNAAKKRKVKYQGKDFLYVKGCLGVRKEDPTFDKEIEQLIK